MSSLKRSLSRKKANKAKKDAEKDLAAKVSLFGELADECLTCKKSFDRMDREQVSTWNVVVREREEKVNLYCPVCWKKAIDLVKEMQDDLLKRREERK